MGMTNNYPPGTKIVFLVRIEVGIEPGMEGEIVSRRGDAYLVRFGTFNATWTTHMTKQEENTVWTTKKETDVG